MSRLTPEQIAFALRIWRLLTGQPPGQDGDKNAPGGSEAKGKNNRGSIIPWPRRLCASCGIPFVARRASHDLCVKCFRWRIHSRAVSLAARALKGRT